jgi:hypothetical protein
MLCLWVHFSAQTLMLDGNVCLGGYDDHLRDLSLLWCDVTSVVTEFMIICGI